LIGISILPLKADAILLVDANTVLADTIPTQPFKPIARRDRKLRKVAHTVELVKLAPSARPHGFRTRPAGRSRIGTVEYVLSSAVGEGTYHKSDYNGLRDSSPVTNARRTIKYTDRHIPVSIFPMTAPILLPCKGLVKAARHRLLSANTDRHNPIMADQHNSVMAAQEAG